MKLTIKNLRKLIKEERKEFPRSRWPEFRHEIEEIADDLEGSTANLDDDFDSTETFKFLIADDEVELANELYADNQGLRDIVNQVVAGRSIGTSDLWAKVKRNLGVVVRMLKDAREGDEYAFRVDHY